MTVKVNEVFWFFLPSAFVTLLMLTRGSSSRMVPSPQASPTVAFEAARRLMRLDGPVRRRLSGAAVSGAYGEYLMIDPMQHASMIRVHFKPGGAAPFLGSLGDLADAHAGLEALWGRSAAELRERLCACDTPAGRFAVLEQVLIARLARAPGRHRAVPTALAAFEQPEARVRDVAAQVGFCQRRFIQMFAAEVGLTPKLYGRVRRFQRARGMVRPGAPPEWARVAVACGYFD